LLRNAAVARTKVTIGTRPARRINLVRALCYEVSTAASKTITVNLSLDGQKLLRRRSTHKVTVTLTSATGTAVARNLTLRGADRFSGVQS
jgi:hypothetical protein